MNARNIFGIASILALGGLLGGCSSALIKPVSVAQVNDSSIPGIRFFQPQPYLLVTELPAPAGRMAPMLAMNGPMQPPEGSMTHAWAGNHQRGHAHGKPMKGMHNNTMNMVHHGKNSQRIHHGSQDNGPQAGHHGHNHGWMRQGGMMMRSGHHAMPPTTALARTMLPTPPQQRVFELQIIYLPDYSHPYVINVKGGRGHSNQSVVLANGWELLGLNVKGHMAQPQPIRAITAEPAMPQFGMTHQSMRGRLSDHDMMHGQHNKTAWSGHNHGQHNSGHQAGHHGMMMHSMMMHRHTAMAMGLQPGLYQFVYNPKTGELEGLRRVQMLAPHHWSGHAGMTHWNKMKSGHHHHAKPVAKSAATTPAPAK